MALACAPTQLICSDNSPETSNDLFEIHQANSIDYCDPKLELPPGFPKYLNSALAWTGSQLCTDQYIYRFTENDKVEINAALASFKELRIDGDLVNCYNFPLPNLSLVLRALAAELHNGRGFFFLRGLDYDRYTVEDNTIIFLGIQSFIAEKRARQDHMGNMMGDQYISLQTQLLHPRHYELSMPDILKGKWFVLLPELAVLNALVTNSNAKPFHTDNVGDVLGFQTRSIASRGGNAVISPAYTIYNELAASRPDVIRILAEPNWPIACPYYHERPILFHHASHIIFNFFNGALLGSRAHPRPPHLPPLSLSQISALYLFQDLAEKNCLSIPLQVGDIHFINNLAVVHRRDAFENAPGRKRHLIRMWLRSEEHAWELPRVLKQECGWDSAFGIGGSDEDGDREEVWHIEPMPHCFFPLRIYQN